MSLDIMSVYLMTTSLRPSLSMSSSVYLYGTFQSRPSAVTVGYVSFRHTIFSKNRRHVPLWNSDFCTLKIISTTCWHGEAGPSRITYGVALPSEPIQTEETSKLRLMRSRESNRWYMTYSKKEFEGSLSTGMSALERNPCGPLLAESCRS